MGTLRLRRPRLASLLVTASLLAVLAPAPLPVALAAPGDPAQPYLTGLDFPVAIAFSQDGRLFYNEKYTGNIRVALVGGGGSPQVLPTPFATVANLNTTAEMGLLGLALDPAWASTPWLYVYHTFDNGTVLENRITRYWAANNTAGVSEDVVTGIPAWDFHNGGILQFGPDGKLWVTTGDARNGALAPNVSYLGGKVLRYNKDGSIPTDNPYAGSPVFSRGHRNLFGLTFEPRTGTPVVTENGERVDDEVNVIRATHNYGWPWDHGFSNNSTATDPIWAISPAIAPTGIIADTSRHPADNLTDLIFGDWNTASLRRLVVGPPFYDQVLEEQLIFTRGVSHVLDLDWGPGGLLYISTDSGIYTSDLTVTGNRPPVPIFWANRSYQFEGASVSFDGKGSYDPEGGGIYTHNWTFGDGTSDNGSFVRHTFAAAGNYTVTLTVTDEIGLQNTSAAVYQVLRRADNQPPLADIFVSRPIQFENLPIGFGAGNSSDPEDGGIYGREWLFGDGTNGSGIYVLHNYTTRGNYTVTLTVTDEFGLPGTATARVQILNASENTPPTAVANASARGWAGFPMNFSSSRSFDREGGIVEHLWTFGDGSTSDLGFANHTYGSPGNYSVTLTVKDDLGAAASTSFFVNIFDPATNLPPTAVLTLPPGIPKAGVPLGFYGRNSTDPEGGIYRHAWEFGDGGTANGSYVTHLYATPGTYAVRLTVFDEIGATASVEVPLVVRPHDILPTVSFTKSAAQTQLGRPVYFDGSASFDEDGWIVDAWWDFGDGTNASGLYATHFFRAAGNLSVTLYVQDNQGFVGNYTEVIQVTIPPVASIEPLGAMAAVAATLGAIALFAVPALRRR